MPFTRSQGQTRGGARLPLWLAFICLGLLSLGSSAASALAAEEAYEYSRQLSLRGDCIVTGVDPIPDPDCPYPAPPGGPSGSFARVYAVAVDAYGNEYVVSEGGSALGRIDIFDDEGHFISELPVPAHPIGAAVDKDGHLYVMEDPNAGGGGTVLVRYDPAIYNPQAGEIQYGSPGVPLSGPQTGSGGVAVDINNGHVYATFSSGFINEYGSATDEGPSGETNPLLNTITHDKLRRSVFVAVDSQRRRLFASNCRDASTSYISDCNVLVFNADTHAFIEEIDGSTTPAGEFLAGKAWNSIAVDEESGHFFIEDLQTTHRIFEFGESFEYLSTIERPFLEGPYMHQMAVSNAALDPAAANHGYLFVPVAGATASEIFAFAPASEQAPVVKDATVVNISETEAEIRATVEPNGADVQYRVWYMTEQQYEEEGDFSGAALAGEGSVSKQAGSSAIGVLSTGLAPGTAYVFRVVAENPKGSHEATGRFATYADAPVAGSCPNGSLRTGPSALLPDCRAYELVTPADTGGRSPKGLFDGGSNVPTVFVSPQGDALSFMIEGGSLPGFEGAGGFSGDRYRATRGSGGWQTVNFGPNAVETNNPLPGPTAPDQTYGFWRAGGVGSAVGEDGLKTDYVMYPDGHSELVGQGGLGIDRTVESQMITENATHILFNGINIGTHLAKQLEAEAPPTGTVAIYDRTSDGVTHVVSLLPGDATPAPGENATFVGASDDGLGVAFEIGSALYLRVRNEVTYEIGQDVEFAGVADGGRRIFYLEDGDIFAFDSETQERPRFTDTGNVTVVNVAPDGSRAYFVSPTAIAQAGENPNGALPKSKGQNLYLSEEGVIRFVGTLTTRDVAGDIAPGSGTLADGLGLWTRAVRGHPSLDPSRVTPDGRVLLFQSRAKLTEFNSGGSAQIYRYDVVGERLQCVSCIPTRVGGGDGASLVSVRFAQHEYESPSGISVLTQNLSPDGRRAFFESTEALVSKDIDGARDVYEWEDNGVGTCTRPGGCVYLISSGSSRHNDFLFGVSRSGDDVFILTEDVLVDGDGETGSLYDARVGGGFAPLAARGECLGDACQPTTIPPPGVSPASTAFHGAGNVRPSRPGKRCRKGLRKVRRHGKVRCVRQRPHPKRGKAAEKGINK